jgi:hypothetical protein
MPIKSRNAKPEVSVARGLGWALVAGAPPLLMALATVSARPATPVSLVSDAAIGAWVAGTFAFAASMVSQRGSARVGGSLGGIAGVLSAALTGALAWLASSGGNNPVPLEAEARAELEARSPSRDGESGEVDALGHARGAHWVHAQWVHPTLEFSMPPLPASMRRSEQVGAEAERAGGPGWAEAHHVWAWEGLGSEVVLDLTRTPRADEAALEELTSGVASGLGREPGRRRIDERTTRLEAPVGGGGVMLAQVMVFDAGGRGYGLVVTVVTRERARWASWLDGVRLPSRP